MIQEKFMETKKFAILQTYFKDVSYESPYFLDLVNKTQSGKKPEVKFHLELQAFKGENNHFEVVMTVNINIDIQEKTYIKVELKYASLVQVFGEEVDEQAVFVEAPAQVYPELRPFVTHLLQMGGATTGFRLPVIDFAQLYKDRVQKTEVTEGN